MHRQMAGVLDEVFDEIASIQRAARLEGRTSRPTWPAIVLVSPKGWTGPKTVDGKKTEGSFRAHQVPMGEMEKARAHPPARILDAQLSARRVVRRARRRARRSYGKPRPRACAA